MGVAHSFTAVASPVPLFGPAPIRLLLPVTVGVGHKPEPVAAMGSADVGSSQHAPPTAIPERGQIGEDSPKSSNKQRWAVLHEDEAGSNLAHNARELAPEPGACAADAGTGAGQADVLAGKAARNDVNTASERSAVKGANVIPNREGREKAVVLSLGKYACGVGLAFDGGDGCPAEQLPGQNSSTSARE
jgi:hypothetical protein